MIDKFAPNYPIIILSYSLGADMLSKADNEFITNTDPGTPMGELFRRFWLPVAVAEELPGPDCAPVRVRVLGEDLIAFRNTEGNVGLVDSYCPHRGAPIFFARNEECGIRCVYHGWKFDVQGNCVDLPNAPEGPTFKEKIKIKSYPAVSKGGLIWAFMGPTEKIPPLPQHGFMDVPDSYRYVWRMKLQCNYLQSMEGDLDATHARFLHSTFLDPRQDPRVLARHNDPLSLNESPTYELIEDTEYGVAAVEISKRPDGRRRATWVRWFMPLGERGVFGDIANQANLRVPIDNKNCWFYRIRYNLNAEISERELWEYKYGGYVYPPLIPGTLTPVANKQNDYLVDRVMQRYFNYTGIKSFSTQDTALIENQRGAVMDRTREHLVSVDVQIIKVRRRLLEAARDLMTGKEPSLPWTPSLYATPQFHFDFPPETPVEEVLAVHGEPKVSSAIT